VDSVHSVAISLFCTFTRNGEELKEVFGGASLPRQPALWERFLVSPSVYPAG